MKKRSNLKTLSRVLPLGRDVIKRIRLSLVLLFLVNVSGAPKVLAQTYVTNHQEFVGPFPSWVNVKTKYGAKGDGVTDDTQALQKAFNEIGGTADTDPKVLYLPAGTYRITAGLKIAAKLDISIIGEDPANTKIKWAGPADGIMFTLNGVAYSRFSRITWDGSGTAHTAIAHFWDGSTGYAVTHNEHSDESFIDVKQGLRGGKPHTMDAETAVLRCRFIRNTIAGVSIESFNALDWYIWDSYFEDCRIGVTNNPPTGGSGNFHVFHSVFKRSTYSDISMKNTMYFSVRENYSIGSKAFFVSEFIGGNGGPITLQKNVILDPIDQSPIRFGSKGPHTILDNVIRSKEGQTGPVIAAYTGDMLTAGNTFTIGNTVVKYEKWTSIDDVVVSRSSVNPSEPQLQGTPQKKTRRVFELIPAPSYAKVDLQKIIDSAAALNGQRPVVHLKPGNYNLLNTLVIPAGSDMQIIGDGFASRIEWRGAFEGEVLRLDGADKVVLDGFTIRGNVGRGVGMVIKHGDDPSKQIVMEGVTVVNSTKAGVLMEKFNSTAAELHNFNHNDHTTVGVKVNGGKLNIFAGSSSSNAYSYDVSGNGSLMAQDIWYESNYNTGSKTFVNLTGSGKFTLNGAKVFGSGTPETPIIIDDFSGKATFLGVNMNGKFLIKGTGSSTSALAMGNQFDTQDAYTDQSPNAKSAMLLCRNYNRNSFALPDVGSADASFIKGMLEQVRSERPRYKKTNGVFVHRVKIQTTSVGIRMEPASAVVNTSPSVNLTSPTNNATLTAPANISLTANATDRDGRVTKVSFYQGGTKLGEDTDGSNGWSYAWSNVSAGNYSITAQATDDDGTTTISSEVDVTVNSSTSTPNQTPTVSAGSDKTITLPVSSVSLTGSASDNDGSIASYSWTKQSGPAASLSGTTTANLTASSLVAGTYVFRLTVKDNDGSAKYDDVTVTVNAATGTPAQQAVVSLTLIDADSDEEIATLSNGFVIDFSSIGTKKLSIRANTNPDKVGSVAFKLDGNTIRTESSSPYTIAGDESGDYNSWVPSLGSHTITATPYTESGGTGTAGKALTISFSVVEGSTDPDPSTSIPPSAQAVKSLTLINADTEQKIATLTEGYVIDFSAIGTKNLSIVANTNPGKVGSVVFKLNGNTIRTESFAPYAINGDTGPDFFAWTPSAGSHTITATPYSASGAGGSVGKALTVTFSVVGSSALKVGTNPELAQPEGISLLSVYPNPANVEFTLGFSATQVENTTITITNTSGVVVKNIPTTTAVGTNSVTVPVTGLAAGTYYIRIGNYLFIEKLMVIR